MLDDIIDLQIEVAELQETIEKLEERIKALEGGKSRFPVYSSPPPDQIDRSVRELVENSPDISDEELWPEGEI